MASGDTLCIFTPLHGEPMSSNSATFDVRNQHPVIAFDADTSEGINFTGVLPQHYAGSGITAYIHYAMATATTGNVDIKGYWERIGEVQDIDADSFTAGQNTGSVTVPGSAGTVDIASIAFTDGAQIDSLAVGEAFRFQVGFLSSGTAEGDAQLVAVELKET